MADDPFELDPSIRREIMQAIQSHYYNITDNEGSAVGGLLVFLDRRNRPVRSELHLHDELSDEVAAAAVRQGYHILGERYYGDEPLPLQVRESFVLGETLHVSLGDPSLAEEEPRRFPLWQIAAGVVSLIVLIGFIWALSSWLRGSATTEQPVAAEQAANSDSATNSSATNSSAASDTNPTPDLPTPTPNSELPPSKNADLTLKIGDQVRIRSGYTLTLRSEAGAEAGEVVGYMGEGDVAQIIDGPILLQGDSDTIMWWLVQMDEDLQAWAAANTSATRLLERMQ